MRTTELFHRALDRETETQERSKVSTFKPSDAALSTWINDTVRPNAFITLLLPFTPGYRTADRRRVRDHQFYLNLWTRTAEAALWGKSAFRIENHDDRCLFLFVQETIRQAWTKDGTPQKLTHYHASCRMPARPMIIERGRGILSIEERGALLQTALIDASKATPEPYAKNLSRDSLRGADIQVQPYRPEHAPYIFKQLRPRFREHWTERLDDTLLRDHGLFILPHLRRRQAPSKPLDAVESASEGRRE